MSTDTRSLYRRLLDAGVPTASHCSDLHFPASNLSSAIVQQSLADGVLHSKPTIFRNQVEGGVWFDAAFQCEPFWDARKAKVPA